MSNNVVDPRMFEKEYKSGKFFVRMTPHPASSSWDIVLGYGDDVLRSHEPRNLKDADILFLQMVKQIESLLGTGHA